jgi:hypothetical protein
VQLEIVAPLEFVFVEGEAAAGMLMIVRGTFELTGRAPRRTTQHDATLSTDATLSRGRTTDATLSRGKTTQMETVASSKDGEAFVTTIFDVKWRTQNRQTSRKVRPLPCFAEFALLEPWVHKSSLLSTGYGEVLRIKRNEFSKCCVDFPHLTEDLAEIIQERRSHAETELGEVADHNPSTAIKKMERAKTKAALIK